MSLIVKGVPSHVTPAQAAAYKDGHLAAIAALGIDPLFVVLNGVESTSEGFYVTVVRPPDTWDGSGDVPAMPDSDGETVARHRVFVPILRGGVR